MHPLRWPALLLCLVPGSLPAAGEPALGQLDELVVKEGFRTAEALRQSGQLEAALLVLRMTYERVRTPFLLWPMAELSEQLRKPLAGLRALNEYIEKVPPSEQLEPGRPGLTAVARLRERLRAQVALLRVVADEPGALIVLDGRQLGRTPLSEPVEVDPGPHHIEAQGTRRESAELVLSLGERREVHLRLRPGPAPPSRSARGVGRWILLGVMGALGTGALTAGAPLLAPHREVGVALLAAGGGVLGATGVAIGLEASRQGRGGGRPVPREP